MNDVTVPSAAAAAAAQATGASEAKTPQPLVGGEIAAAIALVAVGALVVAATLYGFSSSDSHFVFKGKEISTTEPTSQGTTTTPAAQQGTTTTGTTTTPGTGATGSTGAGSTTAGSSPASGKQTQEIDYSDTVAIFALTIGAALMLGGGFYGRLRSLKLGGLELAFVGDDQQKQAADKAAQTVEDTVPQLDDDKKQAATVAAQQVAIADLSKAAALGISPTPSVIDGIAEQAAQKVTTAIR